MAALSPELLAHIARRCDLRALACLVCASKEVRAVVAEAVEEVAFETVEYEAAPAWRLDRFPRLKRLKLDLWDGARQLYDALGLPALRSRLTSLKITLRRERAAEQNAAGLGRPAGRPGARLLANAGPPCGWREPSPLPMRPTPRPQATKKRTIPSTTL
jgi:hypothetical protein